MSEKSLEHSLLAALANPRIALRELDRLDAEDSLLAFVRQHWSVLEPQTNMVEGWALEAICEHLEAVTFGDITRLLINVPPGFMKSLLTSTFWPAWEWGPRDLAHIRTVGFSYASALTERDNRRFMALVQSESYREKWGDRFSLVKAGETLVSNDRTGWKLASSVGGVGTGERGDRVTLDDPHNVKESESKVVREETVRWFRESMSNRLNDIDKSSIVVIMQRVHEEDVSGAILAQEMGYEHLMIPMEYDSRRACVTGIGWSDPRESDGDLAWPERFSPAAVTQIERNVGRFAYAAQYQQIPVPRGGGIFQRDHWQLWPPQGEEFDAAGKPLKRLAYPPMEYILASADTAMTEQTENDPSALTIWGIWRDNDVARVMLMDAWASHLEFHALVEKIIASCRKWRVDRLLVEAKANGLSVAQEIVRLCAGQEWGTTPAKLKGDKIARAYSVQHFLENGLIYAPERRWASLVMDEMAIFPKGKHDDLTDTATQAWRYLRDTGLLLMPAERGEELRRRLAPGGPASPVYDV